MVNSPLRLSVFVPAFNEEAVIGECLTRILRQASVAEIIVVDNGSTDGTARVAGAFDDDRLRIVTEPRPGVILARDAGFAAASGDLVARVDADTLVDDGWADAILDYFEKVPSAAAGYGMMTMYDLPWQRRFAEAQSRRSAELAESMERGECSGERFPQGSNCVVKASVWKHASARVSRRRDIAEDLDLGLVLAELGAPIGIIPGMSAQMSGRRLLTSPVSYWRYSALAPRTYRNRGWVREARVVAREVMATRAVHLAFWFPLRFWDPDARRFAVRNVFRLRPRLGNPN